MATPFTKASACGNDFLIIDGAYAPKDLLEFSRRICDRHNGVGADGVEWLFPTQDADIHARLINADGAEGEISGNGTRCVAAYLVKDFPGDWRQQGEEIGHREVFTQGVNVEFVKVHSGSDIEVLFYERGVGETQSSGTGSCASAVASIARGYASSPLNVGAPGGT